MRTEQIVLNQLVRNKDFFQTFINYIKEDYFADTVEKTIFKIAHDHAMKYDQSITAQVMLNELQSITGLSEDDFNTAQEYVTEVIEDDFDPPSSKWLYDATDKWCSDRSLENAIMKSVYVFQGNDDTITRDAIPDMIRDALATTRDLSIGHDYFSEKESQYDTLHRQANKIPFDIEILNIITKGGLEPKTLNCLMAETGSGKSIFLCHQAANAIKQGKNVVYFSMEMDEIKLAERIDANLLDMTMEDVFEFKRDEYLKVWDDNIGLRDHHKKSYGRLIIKQFPTGAAHVGDFRAFLAELELKKDFTPDMIIVDYLNICSSSRISLGSKVGLYGYVKSIAEELRGLAVEMDVPMWTATQVNRDGMDASDFGMKSTSESVGLPHTLDLFIGMITMEDLDERVLIKQFKNRYADKAYPASRFLIGLNKSKMKFYHIDDWKANFDDKKSGKGKEKIADEKDTPLFDQSTDNAFLNNVSENAFSGVKF